MKAGSKAQIWDDADKKAYDLDDFSKVKALVGSKVTVKGALDPDQHDQGGERGQGARRSPSSPPSLPAWGHPAPQLQSAVTAMAGADREPPAQITTTNHGSAGDRS